MNINQKFLSDIAGCILRCEDVLEDDWDELSVVFDVVDGYIANSGFLYNGENALPIITEIEGFPLLLDDKVIELRQEVYKNCGHKFNQLLFQMESNNHRFKIEFDFDGKNPWTIKPAKLQEMKKSLKPNFDSSK